MFISISVLLSGCGGGGGGGADSKSGALTPDTITISNATGTSVTKGQPTIFKAIATYKAGPDEDITSKATWSYDTTIISKIDSKGVATTIKEGQTTVKASLDTIPSNTITLTVNPLASPIGVQAVSSTDSVKLSWTSVTDATSYNIYFSSLSGVSNNSTKLTSNTSSYVHTGLTAGNTYYYRVSAIDPGAESKLSNEIFSFVYSGGNPAGSFNATGNVLTARHGHTATLLPNGKVLMTGGLFQTAAIPFGPPATTQALNTSELYDPATVGTGTPVLYGSFGTTGSMLTARYRHIATLLPNGTVLISGGEDANGVVFDNAEIYDQSVGIGTFSSSSNFKMTTPRSIHTATLLSNGTVLITGGQNSTGVLDSVEIYDPALGAFNTNSSLKMTTPRARHTATLLPNGKVLIVGGQNSTGGLNTAEIYDPALGTFSSLNLNEPRTYHSATLLANGNVLIAGGQNGAGGVLNSAEVYDAAQNTFIVKNTLKMTMPRYRHTATLLPNGKVLIADGDSSGIGFGLSGLSSTELYNPNDDTFNAYTDSGSIRELHSSTLLPNGKVLVYGGVWSILLAYVYPGGLLFQ
jgi:hypothetical protein